MLQISFKSDAEMQGSNACSDASGSDTNDSCSLGVHRMAPLVMSDCRKRMSAELENTLQAITQPHAAWVLCSALLLFTLCNGAALAEAPNANGPVDMATYKPGPMDVVWQVYVGSAVGVFPFMIGAYEFGKRIFIQRRPAFVFHWLCHQSFPGPQSIAVQAKYILLVHVSHA
jgi:hypothetical protein